MPPAKPQLSPRPDDAPTELVDGAEWDAVSALGDYTASVADDVLFTDVVALSGRWSGVTIEGFQATDVRFANCDLAGLVLQATVSLRRVEFVECRMTGAVFAGAHLRDVGFVSCALDEANLRMIDAQDVAFEDCSLAGADLYAATLSAVTMNGCDLRDAEWSKATLREVDLRTSRLEDVRGAEGLRGATIDSAQVHSVAHSLAVALGITVTDEA